MKPSPYQIAAFTEVARERSFSQAAQNLGVTQSSVTQHIAKLEKRMGTLLFVRRRDGVELTQSARDLFEVSDRLRTLEQLVAEKIASYGDLSAGHLTLIANAPRPVMPVMAAFARVYPQVQVEFSLYDWTTAMAKLRAREVDIAIVTQPDPIEGARVIELDRTRYMAHLRRDHPLAGRGRIRLSDLADERVILPEDGSLTQRVVRAKADIHGVSFSRVVKTATFPLVKEAVLHGIGIGILLENSLYPSSQLTTVEIVEMPETYQHCLISPPDKGDLRLVQSFVDIALSFV